MAGSLDRWKRIVGTGASFALFGFASLLLGLVAYPALVLRGGGRERREKGMQRLIQVSFQMFVGFMKAVGVIRVQFLHPERLPSAGGPCLLVANHPSLIDYVLLGTLLPQADVVVKRSHWSNPFTRGVVRGAGYVPNDSGESTLAACVERLQAGRVLLLFPEGTRSPRGGLGDFQRGAAHAALASGVPATPVTIRCEPPGLMRDQPWWDVPPSRMQFTLEVGEPILMEVDSASRGRASRALTATYREYFEKRLGLV